jgi:hypothetical protein
VTHHSQTCRSRITGSPKASGSFIAATMPSLMGLTRPAMAQAHHAADFAPDVVLPPPPVAGADLMAVHRLVALRCRA